MAWFYSGFPSFLEYVGVPVSAEPLTMACWYNTSDNANEQQLIGLETGNYNTFTNGYYSLYLAGDMSGDPVRARKQNSAGTNSNATVTGYSINTWQHAAGVFTSNTSRQAFINGTGGTVLTTSVTNAGTPAYTRLGCRGSFTESQFSGMIAEVGIWNAALTAAEILELAAGLCPLRVRPQSLVWYVPLIGSNNLAGTGASNPEAELIARREPSRSSNSSGAVTYGYPDESPRFRGRHRRRVTYAFGSSVNIGELVGSSAVSITGSAGIEGTGAIAGSSAATLTPSGTISGTGNLTSSAAITTTGSATLSATGNIAAAGTLTLSGSASLGGFGDMIATASVVIDCTAEGNSIGQLVGSASATCIGSATLNATGELHGSATLNVTSDSIASATGELIGDASFAVIPVGPLAGTGRLFGTTSITIDVTAELTSILAPGYYATGHARVRPQYAGVARIDRTTTGVASVRSLVTGRASISRPYEGQAQIAPQYMGTSRINE